MIKGVYGIVCVLIAMYCLYVAEKCRSKKETMAKATTKVCLSGGAIVLCNSITLFFNDSMIMSIAFSCMFVCANIFLYFLLDYTVQLTKNGPLKKIYKVITWIFIVINACFLLSNPWTNFVLEYKQKVYYGELFFNIIPKTWYYVHCVYNYLAILAVIIVLVVKCFRMPLVYAGRYLTELAVVLGVVVLNLLFLVTPVPVDLSCLLYGWVAWAAYRIALEYQPKYVRKQARYMMANKLQEPILLFDIDNRLADFNSEAAEKFNLSDKNIYSMTREWFETNILQLTYEENPAPEINRETVIQKDYATIIYRFTLQSIQSHRGLDMGKMYVFQDITKQKMMYNALENMSAYDSLTGFYTGRALAAKLEELNKKPEEYVVAICNIAGLKLINSFYDRTVGNQVIQRMSETLRDVLPEMALICYADDDSTVIVSEGITEEQMNLYLMNAARKLKKRGLEKIPIFLNYGIARRENTAVSIEEYIKYAVMDLLIKKGKDNAGQKREMTEALTKEYFRNEYESIEHVKRIQVLAAGVAEKLGLSAEEKTKLSLLCCYHDIGRVKTREEVWSRAAVITRDELDIMKLHSITGYQIVEKMQLEYDIADLVLYHHENYDGSGYPYGLKKENIPLLSRILAIVDSYDVMVNNQLYKEAISEEHALAELQKHAGSQFDPALVKVFDEVLIERK